jgi:hypothetical protein
MRTEYQLRVAYERRLFYCHLDLTERKSFIR